LSTVLEIKNVQKRFGATEILRGIDLSISSGERVALIGPNGAGKTTLFNLVSGRFAPSAGEVWLKNRRIDGKKPYAIARLGLARSFQATQVFSGLSVFENLRCSVLFGLGYGAQWLTSVSRLKEVTARTEALMEQTHLKKQRDTLAQALTYADQRALELGITLGGGADVILLDEPTAGMSQTETLFFLELIKTATHGKTLLMVEHDMGVVFGLADKIAVLVDGKVLAFDTPQAVRANEAVQDAYLGDFSVPVSVSA
jgi:branched-chain amino acid transport system ATP-binding protein